MKTLYFMLSMTFLATMAMSSEPKPAIISKHSSTAEKDGKTLDLSTSEDDLGEWSSHIFPGFGGYSPILQFDDARTWIDLKYGKEIIYLFDPTNDAAPGHFVHKANDVIEWRGRIINGKFVPHALIYRISGVDENGLNLRTRLIVFGLNKGTVTCLGHTEGTHEDTEAKKLADKALPR